MILQTPRALLSTYPKGPLPSHLATTSYALYVLPLVASLSNTAWSIPNETSSSKSIAKPLFLLFRKSYQTTATTASNHDTIHPSPTLPFMEHFQNLSLIQILCSYITTIQAKRTFSYP